MTIVQLSSSPSKSLKSLKSSVSVSAAEVSIVAVVAFGKSSTKKICDVLTMLRVRYYVILPDEKLNFVPSHIILSGSSKHVYDPDYYPLPQWVIDANCPVLAICYGMQLIAHTFGGRVIKMSEIERGLIPVTELIHETQYTKYRWMNRYDRVIMVPPGFTITGVTNRNHIASFTDFKKYFCIQSHPENKKGLDIQLFEDFLLK